MVFNRRICLALPVLLAGCGGRPAADAPRSLRLDVLVSGSGLHSFVPARLALPAQASFYVAVPADGRHETWVFANSGVKVARLVRDALLRRSGRVEGGGRVEMGRTVETQAAALQSARARGVDYAMVITILNWQLRGPMPSGERRHFEIMLDVFSTTSGNRERQATLGGADWSDTGRARPEDILREDLDRYMSS